MDLVEVAPSDVPPVCRILDYGRLRYLSAKKERGSKKSHKSTALREVRFRPNIGSHDLSSKMRKVVQLLDTGAKVKVSVFFRGREVTHQQIGMALLKQVVDTVKEEAKLEKAPSFEGRSLSMIMVPVQRKPEKKPEDRQEADNGKDQDAQGSTGEVPRDGHGTDTAPQADEQSQPPEKVKKRTPAVRS